MSNAAIDPTREQRRQKVKVRAVVLHQAIHHLGNFLTITTAMSNRAVAQAKDPEAQAKARKQFFQLFGEVATAMAALDEAANPDAGQATQALLEDLRQSPEYREMMARMQQDRIAECYAFKGGVQGASVMHPGELCFEVPLRHPCKDFGGWLLGKTCTIDDVTYAVMAVEYKPLKPPFQAGDKVRLVVRSVAADGTVADKPEGLVNGQQPQVAGAEGSQSFYPCTFGTAQGDLAVNADLRAIVGANGGGETVCAATGFGQPQPS